MIHTNKMILVPHEIVGENESISKYLSNLDDEMLNIIQDKTLPLDAKILKYNQVLRRHQLVKQDFEKPIKLEVHEPTQIHKTPAENTPNKQPMDNITETILDTVPQKWHKQAQILLKYAHSVPGMKWSDKGELIVDGNKIIGSHIVDIINDLSRERKTDPVVGSDVFLQKLMDENIPKEAIVNKRRLTRVPSITYAATPQVQRIQGQETSPEQKTPTSVKNKPSTSSIFSNWTTLGR